MSENEKIRRVYVWLTAAGVLVFMLIFGFASDIKEAYTNSQKYNKAIEFIKQGKYSDAEILLVTLDDYKDGKYLYSYACYLNCKNGSAYLAHSYMNDIPENYNGEFSGEIAAERTLCEAAYAEYQKEQDRLDAERKMKAQNNQLAVTEPPVTLKPRTVATRKKKVYPDDELDVYDYYDEEDFYYDHEDDFWDFEDAEDYFNEAWDKVD